MKPIGVYIHIPFCVKKCRYCDFNSGPADSLVKQSYVQALLYEIQYFSDSYKKKHGKKAEADTIYIGGGTPTTLSPLLLGEIMDAVKQNFDLQPGAEISVEANPGTLNEEMLEVLYKAGVNRLSMGLQAVKPELLSFLGRIHTMEDFLHNYKAARMVGFQNINVDLMMALPGQTREDWAEALETVTRLKPEHISAYSLIIEEGTPFYQLYGENAKRTKDREKQFLPQLPDEDTERLMYGDTARILQKAGYERYEISNYAKPGFQCRHNVKYWQCDDYAAFGVSAASRMEHRRFTNIADIKQYMSVLSSTNTENLKKIKAEDMTLSINDEREEFCFMSLRMSRGIDRTEYIRRFGQPIEILYGDVLNKYTAEGFMRETAKSYYLTERGMDVSNYIMSDFIL